MNLFLIFRHIHRDSFTLVIVVLGLYKTYFLPKKLAKCSFKEEDSGRGFEGQYLNIYVWDA